MKASHIPILASFAATGVEYAVVGGIAVNAHGYVRATNDLALFLQPTEDNAPAAYRALAENGVPPLEEKAAIDLLDDECNLRLGTDQDHIDILSSIGEMPFDQVWGNRIETQIDGVPVCLISKQDLIENKRQVGRLRDLADVDELERLDEIEFERKP